MNIRKKPFQPMQTVLVREIWQGQVWTARPMILVQDADLIVLYWVPGTSWMRARSHQDGEVSVVDRKMHNWKLHNDIWRGAGALRLSIPGAKYSVLIFCNVDGTLSNWYINLEYPLKRTKHGFDYIDMILDIIIESDLKTWRWKDEEEFQDAQNLGLISPKEAKMFRTEGLKALKLLQSAKSGFNGWEHWKPDPSWKIPILPEGWDTV